MNKLQGYYYDPAGFVVKDEAELRGEIRRRFDLEEYNGEGDPFDYRDDRSPVISEALYRIKQDEKSRFIWVTDKGELLFLAEMATPHLFFALRMLFNHTVQPAFRVGAFKRHNNVFTWPLDYREQAMRKIYGELQRRTDLEEQYQDELNDMRVNARTIIELGI
jgi:hypothetical protein